MLIDTHNHVGYINKDIDAVVAEMDELGIDVVWLHTWYLPAAENNPGYHAASSPLFLRADGTHASMPLQRVIAACRRHPGRFVPCYCPAPGEGSAAKLFEAAYRMHGVRVCGEWSYRMLLDDPRAIELFRKAGELKCPVVLHMDVPFLPDENGKPIYQQFWHGGTVDNLERAMQACPDTIFVGHAPGFWREISGDADRETQQYPTGPIVPGGKIHRLFDAYPNLWADLSAGSGLRAMQRDREHARAFILKHQDRLLFGRDQFGNALREFLESLDLPADVKQKLYSGNALRLVPLDGAQYQHIHSTKVQA
jgi:predicted TIM-barrel fold metal-dependent hydrolase